MDVIKAASYHQWPFQGGNSILESSSNLAIEFSCRVLLDYEHAALGQGFQIWVRAMRGAYENNAGYAIEVKVITKTVLSRLDIESVQSLERLADIVDRRYGQVPASELAHQDYGTQARAAVDQPILSY